MNIKFGVIIIIFCIFIASLSIIEARKFADRVSARQKLFDTLENDKSTLRDQNLQDDLAKYASSHSLFTFAYSSAETQTDRCKLLIKIRSEENSDQKHVIEINAYMQSVGCQS